MAPEPLKPNVLRHRALKQRMLAAAVRKSRPIDTRTDPSTSGGDREGQIREANAHLVVAAVRAQALTEEAEHESQRKDDFLATVSHEIRTPLNAVLGWARMLESKQLSRARAEHAVAAIGRSASVLAHMIDDILDTSRLQRGTVRLTVLPVDLAAVAQAALDAVRPLATASNIHLSFEAPPDPQTIRGDADRLQQVISNLLVNAVKFTPAGGRVGIVVSSTNDQVELRVVDTGKGIGPDLLPHIFEPFRQSVDATTQRQSGLGLGLGIVRELVELHGGTVQADSPGEGQGATFTVRLPTASAAATVARLAAAIERRTESSTTSPVPRLQRLDGLRILVVDDHVDGRVLTSLVLMQAGANVVAVGSAQEALRIIDLDPPNALVSDIDLSDADGYDLIHHIRQHEAEHGGLLPAVALTGYARAEDRVRALAAGFQVHLPKPVDPAALSAAIAAITRAK